VVGLVVVLRSGRIGGGFCEGSVLDRAPVLVFLFVKTTVLPLNCCRKKYKSKSAVIMTDPFELVYHLGLASFYSLKYVNSKK
jgi:hypothetical protein